MNNLQQTDLNCLPESVVQMSEIIGWKDTEKLVRTIGGTRFKFGKGYRNTDRLKLLYSTIGHEAVEKLLAVFGGDELYIPRCYAALRILHNRRFRAEFAQLTQEGKVSKAMALLALCPKYGISNRTADAILQERENPVMKQESLF